LHPGSSVDDQVTFTRNLAVVRAAQGDRHGALAQLVSIADIVDPYDTRFWKLLATTCVTTGDTTGAIDAYMHGLLVGNNPPLRADLEAVYTVHHGPAAGIDMILDSLRTAAAHVLPGEYGRPETPSGKVMLAELFTGAECGPCAGSDLAFDALAEYYPRTALAILEYHVHIPGPDPMTTNASWDRYLWYAGEGTPTAVFEGRESIIGGGPRVTATNRFHVYRHAIGKSETVEPGAALSLLVQGTADTIHLDATVRPTGSRQETGKPVLHLALVERSVTFTGANGIPTHAFVVRRLVDGASGIPLSWNPGGETVRRLISLAEVQRSITEYLDTPLSQPSWPKSRKTFSGWKARPEHLDRRNLAIVAWIQDMNTKEVLQSAYRDVVLTPEPR
jgi:hypothetical protein